MPILRNSCYKFFLIKYRRKLLLFLSCVYFYNLLSLIILSLICSFSFFFFCLLVCFPVVFSFISLFLVSCLCLYALYLQSLFVFSLIAVIDMTQKYSDRIDAPCTQPDLHHSVYSNRAKTTMSLHRSAQGPAKPSTVLCRTRLYYFYLEIYFLFSPFALTCDACARRLLICPFIE